VELRLRLEWFLTVPLAKALEFALLVFHQSGFLLLFEYASFYIKLPFMKTNKLTAIKMIHFQEVVFDHSLKFFLKNIICSPS
jgi:hypothetical protein